VQSEYGETLESAGRVAQEVNRDAILRTGVLVEDEADDSAAGQKVENSVE